MTIIPSPRALLIATLLASCAGSPVAGTEAGMPDVPALDPGAPDPGDAASEAGCPTDAVAGPGVVVTARGAVRGVSAGDAVTAYRGIPFAAPPLGAIRWRPPAPAACWEGVRDASAYGPACKQRDAKTLAPLGSEDCLTLDVWAPAAATPAAPVPVLVFLHGGGNVQGASGETLAGGVALYDGRRLAGHGVVVVTANYRLGPFGFLALDGLSAESEQGSSGNYGLLDQVAALAWVRDEIRAFGGDPDRVLLFGESAGATDVCALVASPLAKGLFRAALMQSGGCPARPLATAAAAMAARVAQGPCGGAPDVVACLRGLDADTVLAGLAGTVDIGRPTLGQEPASYGPVVDGWALPEAARTALAAGRHAGVPLVIGTNAEELAALLTVQVTDEPGFRAAVAAAMAPFGQAATDAALAAYPLAAYPSPQAALVAFYSDLRFTCPARGLARDAVAGGVPSVHRYLFSRRASTPLGEKPAQHGIELLYVFGTASDLPGYHPAAADLALSEAMMGYWTRLAATGDPDGGGAVAWPEYDVATDPYLRLDDPIAAGQGVQTGPCDVFDALVGGM